MTCKERPVFRRTIDVYLALIAALSCLFCFRLVRTNRDWTLADWLINYQGGFIRRGLWGELFWHLGRWTHLPVALQAGLLWVVLSGVILLCFRSLLLASAAQLWVLAVLVSPATFAFSVLDYISGFRKELVLLALFACFAVSAQRHWLSRRSEVILLSILLCMATLGHESSVFFLPYFFAVLVAAGRTRKEALGTCAFPALFAFAAAAVSARHPGNQQAAERICSSLGYSLDKEPVGQVCSWGAIDYLRYSGAGAFRATLDRVHTNHYLALYGLWTLLALAPLAAGSLVLWRTEVRAQLKTCLTAFAVAWVICLPLFLLGLDWGRWVHIHICCMAGVLLMLSARTEALRAAATRPALRSPVYRRIAAAALLAVYAMCWSLPGSYLAGSLPSYANVFETLRSMAGRHA